MQMDEDGEHIVQVDEFGDPIIHQDEVNLYQVPVRRNHEAELFEAGSVSCIHRCKSEDAKKLCIYDAPHKLKHSGEYDIGGTYTENESDLWFYYSTSICPGYNYLLNLFVCHRKVGSFSIGVSNSNELTNTERPNEISGWSFLPRSLIWYHFRSAQPNEIYYIKTFCFSEKDLKTMDRNNLFIPINLVINSTPSLNNDVLMSIKLQHDLSGLLTKKEKTDFVLISASGKKFPTHKIILVAHSPIIRNLIKDSEQDSLFIDIQDSDMELLLQFMYTGTLQDIAKQDCLNLLNIAGKFQLQNLFLLAQYAIGEQINIESAVNIALMAQKYKLDELKSRVFSFIKKNPKVMQTESWKNLNDVELTKQLIEYIYSDRD
ncbi:hypothetical protein ABMA28_012342 [Loxostege sticticalis]|uniref:BTB domain-containing protein n=1 Tax=Loxostege sticticalis TaxID=481309 RepID=A0ABD0TMT1_LOXSC